jgi:hypothetical protein
MKRQQFRTLNLRSMIWRYRELEIGCSLLSAIMPKSVGLALKVSTNNKWSWLKPVESSIKRSLKIIQT